MYSIPEAIISWPTPEISPPAKEALNQGRSPEEVWMDVTRTRSRVQSMRVMREQGVGHNLEENFVRKLKSQARSSKLQAGTVKKVIKVVMDTKVKDQIDHLKRLKNEKKEEALEGRG